jgi:glycosyltransferase involved in cell wall biosynthesis
MHALTLCLPYYMNAGMLRLQFERIRALPSDLRESLAVIIVDDGSPDGEAQGEEIGCPLTIFRIEVDVRWNQDAARNIAAHHADTRWLLLTDIDHLVPRETFDRIMARKLSKTAVYRFSRVTALGPGPKDPTTPYHPHPNSWLMTRGLYEKIGGYDERFAGHYGTDADFRDRVVRHADIVLLEQPLIRVPREVVPDASTTTYQRKGAPEDVGAIPRIKAERALDPNWKPRRLSFPYRRIWR